MEIKNKEITEEEPVAETKTDVTGQIFSQMPKHSHKSLIYGMLVGLLVVVIAGGAWYWFKVYKKPTPVVEVKTTETENQEPLQKLSSFYYSAKAKDSVALFMYNPNEETSKQIAFSIASPENILGATDKVAYVLSSDSVDGFAIQEYDLSTKKFKVLIKPISSKYHIPRFLLSPDYENIVYSEICYSECDSKYGAEYSHTVTKIFNLAEGSSKILYENRAPQYTFYKVVDKWVGEDQILLGGYCECDGLPPKEEIELVNVKTGNRVVVKLASGQVVRSLSLSPDGQTIAYTSFKLDTEEADTTTYTSYIKVQNIKDNETRTLKTSKAEYYDSINWSGGDRLVFTANSSTKVSSGLGGYYPENSESDLNFILVSSPNNQKTIGSNSGFIEVKFVNEDLIVVSENQSKNVNNKYVEKYNQFIYNFQTETKTPVGQSTSPWLAVYR